MGNNVTTEQDRGQLSAAGSQLTSTAAEILSQAKSLKPAASTLSDLILNAADAKPYQPQREIYLDSDPLERLKEDVELSTAALGTRTSEDEAKKRRGSISEVYVQEQGRGMLFLIAVLWLSDTLVNVPLEHF